MSTVLRDAGHPMRSRAIADVIASRGLYVRRDGSAVPPSDVNVTANDNKQTFRVDAGLISLRSWDGAEPAPEAPPAASTPRPHASARRSLSAAVAGDFHRGHLDLTMRPNAPPAGWEGLPEVAAARCLRGAGATDVEIRIWLTFVAAMDRARDADRLWAASVRLRELAPWVYDPQAVRDSSFSELADALRQTGLSQRHAQDTAAWRLIGETLAETAVAPAVRRAIWVGIGAGPALLDALQETTAAGTSRFPSLRGPKIGPMWVRLMSVPGGAQITDLSPIPVAVDVQVRRVTEHLGVTETRGLELDAARPVIQAAWLRQVSASGAPGPQDLADTCAALDPALWFWGKWGCMVCEAVGTRRPIGRACSACDMPP